MGQRVRMNLRAFILRLREDWIYCLGNHIIVLDSLIFQSCHFCSRFFWMAILKSERFFSSVNRWSGKDFGSSIGVLHEALKIAHTYTFFDENFYGFETVFCIMIFGIFSMFYVRIMQSENFATNIHTHYRQSETAPIYAHYMREKFCPRYIWELRCVWNLWAIDWALVSWRSFVSRFVYAVIVWIRSFLLIGWCQSLVVKVW